MNAITRCPDGDDAATTFIVRCLAEHQWRVTTPDERAGGWFHREADACRFARSEAKAHQHAEVVVLGHDAVDVELFEESRLARSVHVDIRPASNEGEGS